MWQGLAFHIKAHSQKLENLFQLTGQESPASAVVTTCPVEITKCLRGRGVCPNSYGKFLLLGAWSSLLESRFISHFLTFISLQALLSAGSFHSSYR